MLWLRIFGIAVKEVTLRGMCCPSFSSFLSYYYFYGLPILWIRLSFFWFRTFLILQVKLYYSTSPDASSLQWLPPEQTAEKKYPYLFSQCQAIHARYCDRAPTLPIHQIDRSSYLYKHGLDASSSSSSVLNHRNRSMFPCQDAPAVKVTYAAEVLVPAWATVLMSALQGETSVEASG